MTFIATNYTLYDNQTLQQITSYEGFHGWRRGAATRNGRSLSNQPQLISLKIGNFYNIT